MSISSKSAAKAAPSRQARKDSLVLPTTINLAEANNFSLTLTDKRGRPLFELDFSRTDDVLPSVVFKVTHKNGDLVNTSIFHDLAV
jgi:hypothetical protein